MEDSHFIEQDDSHTAPLAFADLCAQFLEQRFYVLPLDVRAGRVGENDLQNPLMPSLHASNGTTFGYHASAVTSDA